MEAVKSAREKMVCRQSLHMRMSRATSSLVAFSLVGLVSENSVSRREIKEVRKGDYSRAATLSGTSLEQSVKGSVQTTRPQTRQ